MCLILMNVGKNSTFSGFLVFLHQSMYLHFKVSRLIENKKIKKGCKSLSYKMQTLLRLPRGTRCILAFFVYSLLKT